MLLPDVGEIEHRVMQRRLAGADAERFEAAFELGDAPLQHRGGRIADAAIAVAFGLEIEQRGAVIGAVELIGDGLVDRNRDGASWSARLITAMNRDRVASHLARHARMPVADSYPGAELTCFRGVKNAAT